MGMIDTQERARQFNEDETVWRRFDSKRTLRRLLGAPLDLPGEILDAIDWQEANREVRQVRWVGKWME